jgi:exosortase A
MLKAIGVRPWWWGLAFVFAAGALWLVATAAGAGVVGQFALAFMLQAALVTILGLQAARVLAFPLVFMLFAVPAGEFLVPTLMDWTADFTVAALRVSGVPVHREGNFFIIPSGAWSVIEACSGIRYVIASLMVGTIYAAIAYRSALRRIVFLTASGVVPIIANWLRAYMIVMLGHLSNNKLAAGVDHIIYGWIFFGVVMLLLFWVGSFWQEGDAADDSTRAAPCDATVIGPRSPRASYLVAAFMTIAVAGVWPPLDARVSKGVADGAPALGIVPGVNNWILTQEAFTDWMPRYSGYAANTTQVYAEGASHVGLYIAFYRRQQKGSELVTSANSLTRPIDWNWKLTGKGRSRVDWNGRETTVDRAELSGRDIRLEAITLYWIAGRITSDPYVAKALQAFAKLRGIGDDAALVAIYTPAIDGSERALELLRKFAEEMSPAIEHSLAAASASGR